MKKRESEYELSDSEDSQSVENDTESSTESGTTRSARKKPDFFIADPAKFFTAKEICHYKIMDKFFRECHAKTPEILTCMINIIEGQSKISLRILDWFVTKYSKKKISFGTKNETFDVRTSYKSQLRNYKKRNFDPFRRRKNFFYPCNEEGYKLENGESKHIRTTLGQLNFFKWAFVNNIITYVDLNLDQIIVEMNNFNKEEKKKKQIIKDESIKLNKEKPKENIIKEKTKPINAKASRGIGLTLQFD